MKIPRDKYLQELQSVMHNGMIKIITGVRRCGKSMLLEIYRNYLKEHGIEEEQIISINFEDLEYEPLQEYHALHEYIVERLIPETPMYVFLDEVQHVPQFEKVVGSLFIKCGYLYYRFKRIFYVF